MVIGMHAFEVAGDSVKICIVPDVRRSPTISEGEDATRVFFLSWMENGFNGGWS